MLWNSFAWVQLTCKIIHVSSQTLTEVILKQRWLFRLFNFHMKLTWNELWIDLNCNWEIMVQIIFHLNNNCLRLYLTKTTNGSDNMTFCIFVSLNNLCMEHLFWRLLQRLGINLVECECCNLGELRMSHYLLWVNIYKPTFF